MVALALLTYAGEFLVVTALTTGLMIWVWWLAAR